MKIRYFGDKIVYIMGASTGTGLAAARLLAGRGARVMLFSRSRGKLEKALAEVQASALDSAAGSTTRQRFAYKTLDISRNDEVRRALEGAVKDFGVPDILINSVGMARPDYFENISYEQFDEIQKTNLYGTWNTCSVLVPHMKKKGGYIVNVSSAGGFVGTFGYTDYSASKFGVLGFSEALRAELKPWNITVSVLCPASIDSPGYLEENRNKPAETHAIEGNAGLMSPDFVAKKLIKGMGRGKLIITPNFMGKVAFLAKRFVPGLMEAVFDGDVKKAQQNKKKNEG